MIKKIFKDKETTYVIMTAMFVIMSLIMNVVSIISIPTIKLGGEMVYVPWALPLAALMMVVADVLSEIFTKKEVIRSIVLGYIGGLILSVWLVIGQAWVGNDPANNVLIIENGQAVAHFLPWDALGQSWRFFLAGLIAYVVANLANTGIMWHMKKKHGTKHIQVWKRVIISTLIGQLLDDAIFITLSFAPIGISALEKTWKQILFHITVQFSLEVMIELMVSPFTVWLISKLRKLPDYPMVARA